MSAENDPELPGELDWSDGIEEVEPTHSDADFRDAGPSESGPQESMDRQFARFANHLNVGLGSSGLFTVSDGFTNHRIAVHGMVREGTDLRILYTDPMRDTFLLEGHNAAGVCALKYFPSSPLSFTLDPFDPHPDSYARTWSMTVEEMSRVYQLVTFGQDEAPFRRKPLNGWHARHLVSDDRVTCLVHGPNCSLQLPLDAGIVTITGSRGSYRWEVHRPMGYGVMFEAGGIHASLPDVGDRMLWQCLLPRLASVYPYEVVAGNQTRVAYRLTGEPILLVALSSPIDPPGPKPAERVVRVAGPADSSPEGLFSHEPPGMGPEVVFAVTITLPYTESSGRLRL